MVFDTTPYVVGPHVVEAIAVEKSSVAVQGSSVATIEVSNPVSVLGNVSDAYRSRTARG